jgi:aquaporin Z
MKTWQKYAAEFFGTMVLVGVGTGAIISVGLTQGDAVLPVCLAFGLALMAALYMFGPISGGHFNPAVSLAAFLDRRINWIDLIGYWAAQAAGALSASALLTWVYSRQFVAYTYPTIDMTGYSPHGISHLAAFFVEAALTLVFVLAILILGKSDSRAKYFGMGVALTVVMLVGIVMTGGSVNPVRALGPAVLGGIWDGFWAYGAGPALGAIVAWALYKIVAEGDFSLGERTRPEVEVVEVVEGVKEV